MAITDKINCSDIRREKSLGLVARSSLIGTLMRAGLLIAAIPLSASAQTSEEIATLKAQVAALQTTVSALQNELTSVKSSKVFALNSFVSVDPNPENGVIGPHITFKGANIHIVSGSGSTIDNGSSTGLGNLIIGYDEYIANTNPSRNGSHNLVIGMYNQFTSAAHGGLVVGEVNTIGAEATAVTGGVNNTASSACGFAPLVAAA